MHDYVPVTEQDFQGPIEDKLLLVEVGDILGQLDAAIRLRGEQPVHGSPWSDQMDAFLCEIFDQIGYLPNGQRQLAKNINGALDACGLFFDQHYFTQFQRQCWHTAAQQLVDRFVEFNLYDATHVHRYDYYMLSGDVLILKLFE